ncbi:LuxR C-terminal-related transcriptional regulator [Geitlerinema sp. CS-897]|uniref:photosynthetic electron transport-dependent transcriptional regulator PedR n=1 Tax=Baaleninema simplex TaxID=2862350 RepID=UPI000347BEE6|nr:LuxR C-terminal-related transcriptional regulator [Baaleninema simplex]MDC0832654.1 LuxR C-terminal-related transcriptional regulator [Geitlerinema sp. CS-897]
MSGTESHALPLLSDRELQVIELVASGLTNQEVADSLEISKRTVDNHISNILSKTETENRVALVRWALRWGKVCLDDVNCCTLPQPSFASHSNRPLEQVGEPVDSVEPEVAS